ncbi:MAG: hypothetical protein LBG68_01320 [Coriobacteriales bacterium]|jgi:hypothetical protein|nr:hypothetical protein [Coriobacteriales bacterium]
MAAHLSPTENYMRMMRGEIPEYVPSMMAFQCGVGPQAISLMPDPTAMEFKDPFGVTMVMESKSGAIPKPGEFILKDITKWRDVIKRPAILDELDWELVSHRDLEQRDPDLLRVVWASLANGYFMNLTYFMGFDNALIACMEEPEEVKALLNYVLELNLEISQKYIDYYRPDVFHFGDDIAHERAPFVSEDLFLDIFEPLWRKHVKLFLEAGVTAEHHNCGAFQAFVPHIVNMGFNSWNPAQPTFNDLPAIKATYGRKLAICGGFESNGYCALPETSDEEVRAEVRRVLDELAPDGGFAFGAFIMGSMDDPFIINRNALINDEFEKNRYKYYN